MSTSRKRLDAKPYSPVYNPDRLTPYELASVLVELDMWLIARTPLKRRRARLGWPA